MSRHEVTPVHHTSGSAFGTKAAGTAGGALKGGIGAAALWILGITAAMVCLGVFIGSGGLAAMVAGGAAGGGLGIGGALSSIGGGIASFFANPAVHWGLGLGVVGLIASTSTAWLPGGLGAIFGGLGGHSKASNRVSQERAAAMQMDYELAAMQAQAAPCASAPAHTGLPAHGTQFNQAAGSIQCGNGAEASKLQHQQLARA